MFAASYLIVALIVVLIVGIVVRAASAFSADEKLLLRRDSPELTVDPHEERRQYARHETASMVVDAIKLEMARLRTDIVWTIENSALWDISVPTSRAFFTALSVWDDYHASWSIQETVDSSAELKVLWRSAVDTAVRLGVDHLSATDRPKAETAIKLVRKAESTTSEAERHQLMSKAAAILSSVMSITIPRETMRELERRGVRPALEDPPANPEQPG